VCGRMRSPALGRGVNKSLKKPAREPRNERKDFMALACFKANYFMHRVVTERLEFKPNIATPLRVDEDISIIFEQRNQPGHLVNLPYPSAYQNR